MEWLSTVVEFSIAAVAVGSSETSGVASDCEAREKMLVPGNVRQPVEAGSATFGLLEPAHLDVVVEGRRRPVVGRDVVPLPTLLVEPQPPRLLCPEVVLPPHPQHRAHPRQAVEHDREQPGPWGPRQGVRIESS